MSEEVIQVVYNADNTLMVVLGEAGVELTRAEAEQLFLDLGHALQELDRIDNQA